MNYIACVWSFFACAAFCFVFNIRGRMMFLASIGGALGWFIFLLLSPIKNDIVQFFFASMVVSVYSEIMARICKKPVTQFQVIALIPMVPGGGIFYTMEYCVIGNSSKFIAAGLHTLGIAGALAMGILLVSTFVRFMSIVIAHAGDIAK